MRKGWIHSSIIIGLAAILVAFTIMALMTSIAGQQARPINLLYQSGADPMTIHQYDVGNSLFVMEMIALLLLGFTCGMLSFIFARSADDRGSHGLIASVVAGVMPAIAFGVFQLNGWRNAVSQPAADSYMRPIDPLPDVFVIGLLAVLAGVLVLASLTGGWLAHVALERAANDAPVTRKK